MTCKRTQLTFVDQQKLYCLLNDAIGIDLQLLHGLHCTVLPADVARDKWWFAAHAGFRREVQLLERFCDVFLNELTLRVVTFVFTKCCVAIYPVVDAAVTPRTFNAVRDASEVPACTRQFVSRYGYVRRPALGRKT